MENVIEGSKVRGSWLLPVVVLIVGGVALPIAYEKAFQAGIKARQWLTMQSIQLDLEGREIVIDARTSKKTKAEGMSKEDVLKAFWLSEMRRSQLEYDMQAIKDVVGNPSSIEYSKGEEP